MKHKMFNTVPGGIIMYACEHLTLLSNVGSWAARVRGTWTFLLLEKLSLAG